MKILIKIILSPFLFLFGCFISVAGMLFPIPLLMLFGFGALIVQPFIFLLRRINPEIEYFEEFEEFTPYRSINYIIMICSPLLIPFYVVIHFIKTSEVAFISENTK